MPYQCSAGDDDPVIVHLQQLEADYEQVDFCAAHWVQFIASTAAALGIYDPGDVDGSPGHDPVPFTPTDVDGPQLPQDVAEAVAQAESMAQAVEGASVDDSAPAPY